MSKGTLSRPRRKSRFVGAEVFGGEIRVDTEYVSISCSRASWRDRNEVARTSNSIKSFPLPMRKLDRLRCSGSWVR